MGVESDGGRSAATSVLGRYQLEEGRGVLIRPDGATLELRPQTSHVLAVLLERAGEIVSRDELLAAVWPGTSVTDDSVTQCIREIRASLGTDGHRLLHTYPKRGYMLDSAATQAEAVPSVWSRRWRLPLAAAGGLVALVGAIAIFTAWDSAPTDGRPQIAVLPFEDLYQTDRWSRIGAGLSAEIVATLAREDWIEVRWGGPEQVRQPQAEGYVLSGTISADSGHLRLTGTLSEAATGQVLWSEVWAADEAELFDMQSQVLEKIEATVAPAWTGVIARRRMAEIGPETTSLGSYDHYLEAIDQKHRFTPDALDAAERHLMEALAQDPDFARAWSALSAVHLLQMGHANSRAAFDAHLERRIVATREALHHSPNDPEALLRSTFLDGRDRDHTEAEAALRRAAKLAGNDPDLLAELAWHGSPRAPLGGDAVRWAERALALNPTPPAWYYAGLGTAAFYAEDFETASDAFAAAPQTTEVIYRRAATAAQLGDLASASEHLELARGRLPAGMTIAEVEAADGRTYPPYVERLDSLLAQIPDS
jgi:DNA-binding winged helix-turn-helix (wHTH) protein/TolB-like protein